MSQRTLAQGAVSIGFPVRACARFTICSIKPKRNELTEVAIPLVMCERTIDIRIDLQPAYLIASEPGLGTA